MAALRYYMHDNVLAFRFQLIGALTNDAALDLRQAWRTAASTIGGRPVLLDLSELSHADASGTALLESWRNGGAQLVVTSDRARKRLLAITPLSVTVLKPHKTAGFSPRPTLLRLALFFLLLSPVTAASLGGNTIHDWDQYIQTVTMEMRARASADRSFLWIDESPERRAKVQAGGIVIAPAGSKSPRKVANGLIHHWLGAVFVPKAKLEQTLLVMRDYDRYKDYYRPVVVDSKALACGEAEDQFSILLSNPSLFRKGALDGQYKSVQFPMEGRRSYSITQTTRIQEITGYGSSKPRVLPEDQGTGLIWRLFSITRLQERDGGVYIEAEAIALSRDIPNALRWLIEPIVRRTAQSALDLSLKQTRDAILAANAVTGGAHNE